MIGIPHSQGTLVIKLGGNALVHDDVLNSFASAIRRISEAGFKIAITHGGGPQISKAFTRVDEVNEFVQGYRKTSTRGVEIVKEVLCADIQSQIVSALSDVGIEAVGICGDSNIFFCIKKVLHEGSITIDLGHVGDVRKVNAAQIESLLNRQIIPVVSAVGTDEIGTLYNINADTGAGALAAELHAEYLVLLTDVTGVYANWPDPNSLISSIRGSELDSLIESVDKGMIPKLEATKLAIENGVRNVLILNGQSGSVLESYFLNQDLKGTLVTL